MLELKNVSKRYGNGEDRVEVLEDISLRVEAGRQSRWSGRRAAARVHC